MCLARVYDVHVYEASTAFNIHPSPMSKSMYTVANQMTKDQTVHGKQANYINIQHVRGVRRMDDGMTLMMKGFMSDNELAC